MAFTIERDNKPRQSFGEYQYRILLEGKLIAYYWHDYRGEEHGIDFVGGKTELWPVGRMIEFLEGGGPKPLMLSEAAVVYLKSNLSGGSNANPAIERTCSGVLSSPCPTAHIKR